MSEILQSVSLLDDSGLANGCNSRLSGQNTSKSSRGAFNLKVESSRNGVLGQAGGGAEWSSSNRTFMELKLAKHDAQLHLG